MQVTLNAFHYLLLKMIHKHSPYQEFTVKYLLHFEESHYTTIFQSKHSL